MSKKKTTTKKPATKKSAAKKPTTAVKKSTATKKKTATTKPKTTTTKKLRKPKFVKAQIIGYRRNNRLQTTNQAVVKMLEDYNHKALVGNRFVLKFSESDAIATGIVTAVHGQARNKQLRLRFEKSGMSGHAINEIVEIQI